MDASGRRARLLRRAGLVLGTVTLGYVAVLGLAFMGGISLTPSQILPFDGGPPPGAGEVPPMAPPAASTGSDR
ncbi:hypothetical protein ACFXKG_10535 [Streptomyces sp. NPDC059255]|uniref:hypothetical protein n=1 Tax=Streptomyces sp. NPDC059255 TaxID=3346793 RepID=UPI00368533E8